MLTDKQDKKSQTDEPEYDVIEDAADGNKPVDRPGFVGNGDDDDDEPEPLPVGEAKTGDAATDDEQDDSRDADSVRNQTDEERDAKREQRRKERREKALRRNQYREEREQTIAELKQLTAAQQARIAALEGRTYQREADDVDTRMRTAQAEYQRATALIAKATENNDGAMLAEGLELRDAARDAWRDLQVVKQRLTREPEATQAAADPQPSQIDSKTKRRVDAWAAKNPWFDPNGRDQDSLITAAIDKTLMNEGYDPASADYWEELDDRLAEKLPHRFKPQQKRDTRGGPRNGGAQEAVSQNGRREVRLSPERVQALRNSGAEPGTPEWNRKVRYYIEYDKQQARTN